MIPCLRQREEHRYACLARRCEWDHYIAKTKSDWKANDLVKDPYRDTKFQDQSPQHKNIVDLPGNI